MPWDRSDVARHHKEAAKHSHSAKVWVDAANAALAWCQKNKMGDCEGRAVRIANAAANKALRK